VPVLSTSRPQPWLESGSIKIWAKPPAWLFRVQAGFLCGPIASMYLIEYMSFDFAFKMFGIIIVVGVFIATLFMRAHLKRWQKPYGYDEVIKKKMKKR